MKVFAGRITSSPGPTSAARSAISSASVPLAIPMQERTPTNSAYSCSNAETALPPMKSPARRTSTNPSSTSSATWTCWTKRSTSGIPFMLRPPDRLLTVVRGPVQASGGPQTGCPADDLHDELLLLLGHRVEEREDHGLVRQPLGHREVAVRVPRVRRLAVGGHDPRPSRHPLLGEGGQEPVPAQRVAAVEFHPERLEVGLPPAGVVHRAQTRDVGQHRPVRGCELPAPGDHRVELPELDETDGGLHVR